jgi:hypothetical protein
MAKAIEIAPHFRKGLEAFATPRARSGLIHPETKRNSTARIARSSRQFNPDDRTVDSDPAAPADPIGMGNTNGGGSFGDA